MTELETSSASEQPRSVLIAEAGAILRAGLRLIAQQTFLGAEIVDVADSEEALATLRLRRFSLTVIGASLSPAGGLQLTHDLLEHDPAAAILFCGFVEDGYMAVRAMDAGALGFISQENAAQDVAAAFAEVAQRRPYLSPDIVQRVALLRVAARRDPLAPLSVREFEIFRLLTEGKTVQQISKQLALSVRSVANYQTQIKRKLKVPTVAGLVHIAIRHGVVQIARE